MSPPLAQCVAEGIPDGAGRDWLAAQRSHDPPLVAAEQVLAEFPHQPDGHGRLAGA
jgi:hypothetical protein